MRAGDSVRLSRAARTCSPSLWTSRAVPRCLALGQGTGALKVVRAGGWHHPPYGFGETLERVRPTCDPLVEAHPNEEPCAILTGSPAGSPVVVANFGEAKWLS